jgi:hypothetical protein
MGIFFHELLEFSPGRYGLSVPGHFWHGHAGLSRPGAPIVKKDLGGMGDNLSHFALVAILTMQGVRPICYFAEVFNPVPALFAIVFKNWHINPSKTVKMIAVQPQHRGNCFV